MVVSTTSISFRDGYRPPTITPPAKRRGRIGTLRAAVRNPLTIWPEEMYDGAPMKVRQVGWTAYHIADPALVKRVLLDEADNFARPRLMQLLLGPAMGEGLLTTDGDVWRRQRRICAPSFRVNELKALTPFMSRAGAAAGDRLAKSSELGEGIVDVAPFMVRAAFDVINDSILGEDGRGLVDPEATARDAETYLNTHGRIDPLDLLNAPRWMPRPHKWGGATVTRRLRRNAAAVVAARRAAGAGGAGLADRLIRAIDPDASGGGLTDMEVVDNIMTFFGAGHETTATALTWTLMILAHQPQYQDALRAETEAVSGDAPINAEHIERLDLHGQVIKEAMRLYPPASVIARRAVAPIRIGEHELKAGDEATIAIYVMHRRRDLWDRPDMFDPRRFAADAPPIDRFAYMPFGGGPRICIGWAFAQMEATALLAEILRRVRVSPGPEREVEPLLRVTLRPRGGMPLRVQAV